MKFEVKIEKKHAFMVVGAFMFLAAAVLVYAYASVPNPGHGADSVVVTVGGVEKTLQAAIDAEDFAGGASSWPSGAYCIIQYQGLNSTGDYNNRSCPTGFSAVNPTCIAGAPGEPYCSSDSLRGIVYGGPSSAWDPTTPKRADESDSGHPALEWAFCCKL